MLEYLLLQTLERDVQVFQEYGSRFINIDAKPLKLELLVFRTDAELKAAARNNIGKANFGEKALRLIKRQHADGGAEANSVRHSGTVGHHHY